MKTWNKYFYIVGCQSNYTISNGRVNFPKTTVSFGNTVSIECNTGYEVQGNGYITCLADGTWSNDASCSIRGTSFHNVHLLDTIVLLHIPLIINLKRVIRLVITGLVVYRLMEMNIHYRYILH